MIDHMDKQTQPLPLEQKRGRGRPATGQALSNAERQRRYREAQKAQRNGKVEPGPSWEDARALVAQIDSMNEELEQAKARIVELESQLAKAKAKAAKAGPTKRRYVLQYRYENSLGVQWHDDTTGDYGSRKEAEKACKGMNKPGVSETEWRVRERQWV